MVFLSCSIGAGIGYLLALRFGVHLWLLGTLAGGILGYFVYDIKHVVAMIPEAWKQAKEKVGAFKFAESVTTLGKWIVGILGIFLFPVLSMVVFIGVLFGKYHSSLMVVLGFVLMFAMPFFTMMIGLTTSMIYFKIGEVNEKTKGDLDKFGLYRIVMYAQRGWWAFALTLLFQPVLASWLMLRGIVLLIPPAYKATVKALRLSVAFVWNLIKLIHSDVRLLVGIDSIIGGIIGYSWHSLLIGMLAGGILGLVNYKLVSIKWLKLKPKH